MSWYNLIVSKLYLTISRPSVRMDGRLEVRSDADDLLGYIGGGFIYFIYSLVETDISFANIFTIDAPASGVTSDIPMFFASSIFDYPEWSQLRRLELSSRSAN